MTGIASAELLEKGAAYIEEHGLWQGSYWNFDDPGLVLGNALEAGQLGLSACGVGALHISTAQSGASTDVYLAARDAFTAHLFPLSIPQFNDAPGRTAGEVADEMRDCAAGLRGAPVRPISDRTMFTGRHRDSPFTSTWTQTRNLLDHELRQLRARNVVLEMDVREDQIRIDGQVRADARPSTPAVRLAFESSEGPLVYATDRFWGWQDNVRAIALGMEALRRVERYGIANRGEQYAGYKQLGAGRAMPASHMTSDEAWSIIGSYDSIPIEAQRRRFEGGDRSCAMDAFKRARFANHPDRRDGDRSLWDKVEAAGKVLGLVS